MTLLDAINRIFRLNAIIRGDTDVLTSFNSTQHNASLNLALVAVQNELGDLVSDRLIPAERKTTGSIATVIGQRTYTLPADFTRFYGTAHFYLQSSNRQIYEYPGGLAKLQTDYYNYDTAQGSPNWWYWEPASTKKVGFYQVPNAVETWTFDYEGSVMISQASDTLPFANDEESYAFCEMAGRRFKFMFEDVKNELDVAGVLDKDTSYRKAKARLINFIKGQNPRTRYGFVYA